MGHITLTQGQQAALQSFAAFLMDPKEAAFVLSGYSGTGKTTLVNELLERLPNIIKTVKLLNPSYPDYDIALTATTNKAAEVMSQTVRHDTQTIHSFLGLRVQKDYESGETFLVSRNKDKVEGFLIFIDEASYIDKQLLSLIFKMTEKCKIVFMGDPAQLTPVKSSHTPVFSAGFPGASLTEVVRQAKDNPIIDLSTRFRETVTTGEFFSFTPDGDKIVYLSREDFDSEIEKEFTRRNWSFKDSKILAWTNKTVQAYNTAINTLVSGEPHFKPGDYAICNKFISVNKVKISTDQVVYIRDIEDNVVRHGVRGKYYSLDNNVRVFGPDSIKDQAAALKRARAMNDYTAAEEIDSRWVDLRQAYSCTINKAQGSTFDRVFIDLDDIRKCNSGDQIARMLYVAVSRARYQVFLTGDLV